MVGPLFSREALIAPRQLKHFLIRSGYVAVLFVLMYTASQAAFGWQQVYNVGDFARFGNLVFQIFCFVQLSLALFFAILFAAGNVSQEKDRQTLILLLMTDLRSHELVLGKLSASLLLVAVLVFSAVPAFVLVHILGGVDLSQIAWSIAICASAAFAAGTWGNLVAFWREKTFQTLAISVLGAVLYIGVVEAVSIAGGETQFSANVAMWLNPYRAMLGILTPFGLQSGDAIGTTSALGCVVGMVGLGVLLNGITIARLRIWNPSQAAHAVTDDSKDGREGEELRKTTTRQIWQNPVIWREICTRAYGRKILFIKLAYYALALFVVVSLVRSGASDRLVLGMISPTGFGIAFLGVLSLLLVNAQAVTSLTSERDARTLELLLATNVTAKEFVYGKLGGVFYNTKELIAIPLLLAGYYAWTGVLLWENLVYLIIGFGVLVIFSAMLGLHSGLSFDSSRSAIANSLGTLFFLFIGILVFMMLLVEARSSFFIQFQSFIVFIGVGSIGLYASLTHKNPSLAMTISAGVLPFFTFYAITEFLLRGSLGVCLAMASAYGFAALAMLVPAVSEFDVALGRTTLDKG